MLFGQLFFGLLVSAVFGHGPVVPTDCPECVPEECREMRICVTGVIWDRCHCCEICAKSEYELCAHLEVPGSERYGQCGDNLECRLRTDLPIDEEGAPSSPPEALCYCLENEAVCGDDGETKTTYTNVCQMDAVSKSTGKDIAVVSTGPCDAKPEILSGPENTHNMTGDNVVLSCEARGFPIPIIEWSWTRVDGKTFFMPNDDVHVSVNVRGGPERFGVTGWLQIMDIQKSHEGDYTCVAQNSQGMARASARVKVINNGFGKKHRPMNREDDL